MKAVRVLLHYLNGKYGYKPKSQLALQRLQQRRFHKLQKTVLLKSPYYAPYLPKSLADYPMMDKAIMMAKFNNLNTVGLDKDKALSIAIKAEQTRDFAPKLNGYTVGLSSGTSGNKGIFVVSDKEQAAWLGQMLAIMLPGGLWVRHRIALFMRANSNLYDSIGQHGRLNFKYFDLSKSLADLFKSCHAFQPTILVAPPKVLKMIAKSIQCGELNIKPEKIISIADVLEQQDKRLIEQVFGQVVHQIYQCTEGFLGGTCKYGTLHLNEQHIIFEKEWLDKTQGKFIPIITDLQRQTQPIVRYRLNDILTVKKAGCRCNHLGLAIETIEGRADQILYFSHRHSSVLHPVFPDFIRHAIITANDTIEDYQVVQISPSYLKIGLSRKQNAIIKQVQTNITALLGAKHLNIPNMDFVPLEAKPLCYKQMRVKREFIVDEYD